MPTDHSPDHTETPVGSDPAESGAGSKLLGVFPDEPTAQQARQDLAQRGVDAEVAGPDAVREELRAEMRGEADGSVVGPGLPAHPKMLVGAVPFTIGMAALGALLFAGLAWLITIPDVGFGQRVTGFAIIGAATFATAARFVRGTTGSRMPHDIPAAQRGATLVVHDASRGTAEAMAVHAPIRIDRQGPDGDITAVMTEDQLHEGMLARRAGARWRGADRADD